MNKYKKLVSDTALFMASSFASKLLVFLMLPFYTNILTVEEYAVADLIITTQNIFFPILTLSISEAMLRFPFDNTIKKNELLTIGITFVLGSTLVLMSLSPVIACFSITLSDYWLFFIGSYFATAAQTLLSYYIRGCGETKIFAIQGIVHAVVLVGCNILFLLVFNLKLEGYLLSIILSNLSCVVYMVYRGNALYDMINPRWNQKLCIKVLQYSVPMVPTVIAWWIMQTSDKYIIIAKLGLESSGIYSVAYKIPSMLSIVTSLFTQAWQISAIQNYDEKDNPEFVGNVYNVYSLLNTFVCGFLILLTKPLSYILYAKEFYVAWICVPILLLAYVFNGISGMLQSVFTASKKTKYLMLSTGCGAILNVILNFIFVEKFGIIGAAWTTLIGFIATWVIRFYVAQKIMPFPVKMFRQSVSYILLLIEAVIIIGIPKYEMLYALIPLCLIILLNYQTLRDLVKLVICMFIKIRRGDKVK